MANADHTVVSKQCTKCGETKPATKEYFHSLRAAPGGLAYQCKLCTRAENKANYAKKSAERASYAKAYRASNKEIIAVRRAEKYAQNRDAILAANKARRQERIELFRARARARSACEEYRQKRREHYAKNRDAFREKAKAYRAREEVAARHSASSMRYERDNREKVNARRRRRQKQRMETDAVYAARRRISGLIRESVRRLGFTKQSTTGDMIGCDWVFFKDHIERQFLKGMTWDNRSEWHIDHIVPIASAKTEEDVIRLNHFTNLRPMWAKDNIAKGDRITHLV